MNQTTYRPPCSADTMRTMYASMTQREIAAQFNVSTKAVQTALRRFGIPARKAAKRDQFGERNTNWKGASANYHSLHHRVETRRGKPKHCDVCGCDDPSRIYDWANLTGRYDDQLDFKRMCRSCHRHYDYSRVA